MMNDRNLVHHFLERSSEIYPDSIAVVYEKSRMAFKQINNFANQLAHSLVESGVRVGDRIALICENSTDYIICYYGILKAGCVAVPLNTELKPSSIKELLDELRPKALIISSKFEPMVQPIDLSQLGIQDLLIINPNRPWSSVAYRVSSLYEFISSRADNNLNLDIDPQAFAMIIYTSGSVGRPKGVVLSHANVVANTLAIVEYLKLTSNDIQMVVLPFFYVMGKSLLNTHFAVGGRVVLNNRFAYTASVLKQMAEERVTGFSGVPSTFAHLLFKSPLASFRDQLPALRYCSQAGGHMPKHIKLELLKTLPSHTQLFVMYGATEASARLTYVPPESLMAKIDSIGKPISGVSMKVYSPDGAVLKAGEIGELVAQGANIMIGYYQDDAATRRVLDQNGYHTGDLGYYDEDGFFYVTGRKDNQLKVGGHRVNPQEIEDVIIESGFAMECFIFGIPDPLLGHRLGGLVVPVPQKVDVVLNILKYCGAHLPKYKNPESIFLVEAIPKNSSGKHDRLASIQLFVSLKEKGHKA
jgi:acyl-CoA synthetase (AMP-forming)/AMP-acid ligase II